MLKEKLGHHPVTIQMPIGAEDKFKGIIDLDHRQGLLLRRRQRREHPRGRRSRPSYVDEAKQHRDELIAARRRRRRRARREVPRRRTVSADELRAAIRRATLALKMTPVMCGSAYKNKGVQLLLDGVVTTCRTRPRSTTRRTTRTTTKRRSSLESDPTKPFVGLAFKLEDGRYGQLTYIRIYQGKVTQGRHHLQRSARQQEGQGPAHGPHALGRDERHHRGAGRRHRRVLRRRVRARATRSPTARSTTRMTSMHVPDAVISLAVAPKDKRRPGQLLQGAQPLHQGRPDLPRAPRRGVARRPSSAAWASSTSTSTSSACKREYNCEVDRRQAAGRVPRDDHAARPSSTTRTRSRPVARVSSRASCGYIEPLPADAVETLRVRRRHHRRLDSARVHPGVRQGLQGGASRRAR